MTDTIEQWFARLTGQEMSEVHREELARRPLTVAEVHFLPEAVRRREYSETMASIIRTCLATTEKPRTAPPPPAWLPSLDEAVNNVHHGRTPR